MNPFWALRIYDGNGDARLQRLSLQDLTPGEVVLEVHYSSINYKDALAATGKGRILKSYPINGGIDAAGIVLESMDPRFKKGQEVVVTGCGLGESFDGGYSEIMRVAADSVVPLPAGLSMKETMILGTAGFTAALAAFRMLQNGQKPEQGPILVTGASGGVGSFAIQIFSHLGFEVVALSGKHEIAPYLKELGAHSVMAPEDLNLGHKPVESIRFGGAVDSVGGEILSHLLAHIEIYGNVASVGLALGADLKTSVMPFILRGVSLLGTSSTNCPYPIRSDMWQRLASDWKPKHMESLISRTIGLKDLMLGFDDLLHRRIRGRILVEIRK